MNRRTLALLSAALFVVLGTAHAATTPNTTAGADHFARTQKIQTLVAKRVALGTASAADAADYYVAEAQLWK